MNKFLHIASKLLKKPSDSELTLSDSSEKTPEEDDSVLVKRAQSGDYTAFDELVKRHRGKVYAMIINMVKHDADAWDLAQDSFVKAWKALPKFEARSKFSTWLFRISHNVVYDWMRKKKIRPEGEFNDEVMESTNIEPGALTAPSRPDRPDQVMAANELREKIQAAMATLSPNHQEVVLLREVQGLEYKEIAEALDCSVGTVMSRLFYARKKLQTLLRDEAR